MSVYRYTGKTVQALPEPVIVHEVLDTTSAARPFTRTLGVTCTPRARWYLQHHLICCVIALPPMLGLTWSLSFNLLPTFEGIVLGRIDADFVQPKTYVPVSESLLKVYNL